MSTAAQPSTERAGGARGLIGAVGPRIRLLVPPLRSRWRPSFVSVCVTLMVACLSALLGINIVLTRGAYDEQQLTLQQTALMEQEQTLGERVARESAPEVLAQRARDLGMIPNSSPAFIRMSDGTILGVPTPASVAESPAFSDLTSSQLTPEQAAAAAAAANGGAAATADGAGEESSSGTTSSQTEAATAAGDAEPGNVDDGAVPVTGQSADTAGREEPGTATTTEGGAEPTESASAANDGAQPVGGAR